MRAIKLLFEAVLAATVLAVPTGVNAVPTTWHVKPSGPGTSCADGRSAATALPSIQMAVDCAAPSGDTIFVEAGTYTENVSIAKNLLIVGEGRTVTTVRAQSHLLPVVSNSGTVTITKIRIKSGSPGDFNEGGVFNDGTLTLSQSSVVGTPESFSFDHGGIENQGTLTLKGSRVTGHYISDRCGAGILSTGTLRVQNSQIDHNSSANCGGGIEIVGPTTITGSTISMNHGDLDGGGIKNDFVGGTVTVSNSKIRNNSANSGGGISNYSVGAAMTIRNTEVSGNDAYSYGGGIRNNGSVTLASSRVVMNTAGIDGGGIYNTGTVSISPDTEVSGNVPNDCVGC